MGCGDWDETYAKLGWSGMTGEGVGEAGVFTRRYILELRICADPALKSSGADPSPVATKE